MRIFIVAVTLLFSSALMAYDYVSAQTSSGYMSFDHHKKDVWIYEIGLGSVDERTKITRAYTFKHFGTKSVMNTLGVELSKGFNSLSYEKKFGEDYIVFYPFVKVGTGFSLLRLIDVFVDDDEDDETHENIYKDKKELYFSGGVGLNFSIERLFSIYVTYDRYFFLPPRDMMSVGSVGMRYRF